MADEGKATEENISGMTDDQIAAFVNARRDTVDSNNRITDSPLKDLVRTGVELLKKDKKYCESIRIKQ